MRASPIGPPPPPPRLMPAIRYWDSMFWLKSPKAILPRLISGACDCHAPEFVQRPGCQWEVDLEPDAAATNSGRSKYSPSNCTTLELEESSAVFTGPTERVPAQFAHKCRGVVCPRCHGPVCGTTRKTEKVVVI